MASGSVWWAPSLQVMRPCTVPPSAPPSSLTAEGTMYHEVWLSQTSRLRMPLVRKRERDASEEQRRGEPDEEEKAPEDVLDGAAGRPQLPADSAEDDSEEQECSDEPDGEAVSDESNEGSRHEGGSGMVGRGTPG